MIKKIGIALTVILLAGLICALRFNNKRDGEYSRIIAEMNTETSKYSLRIAELNSEIKDLEQEIFGLNMGNATTQFIVTDITEESGVPLIDALEQYEYPGVIAVTSKKYPGGKGMISKVRAKELAAKGWTFCYYFDSGEASKLDDDQSKAFAAWLKAVKKAASDNELELSPAILFPQNTYKDNYNGAIKKNKIDTVILHGEKDADSLAAVESDGIWYLTAQKWYDVTVPQTKYSLITGLSGNITVEVTMDGMSTDNISQLISVYDSSVKTNSINVTDLEKMKEIQEDNKSNSANTEEINALLNEKNAEIAELEAKIAEIEKEYTEKAETYKRN